nr:MAG TPA: TMEM215 family [Caudoviricetes sp.]
MVSCQHTGIASIIHSVTLRLISKRRGSSSPLSRFCCYIASSD